MTVNPTESPDVSIIIVTWNSGRYMDEALSSLREHATSVKYEVVAVENGSLKDPYTPEQAAKHPDVRYIRSQENLGFSKGNNLVMKEARGRYVLLLNPDTRQVEDAVGKAVHYLDSHPDVGVLGILHLNDDAEKTPQASCFPFPNWKDDFFGLWKQGVKRCLQYDEPGKIPERDVDWVCGSFLCVRAECIKTVGMLDEAFFSFDEDIDWCHRISKAGWKVRFWPGASLVHKGSSSGPLMSDKALMNLRSRLTYYYKDGGFCVFSLIYSGLLLKLSLGLMREILRLLLGKSAWGNITRRLNRLYHLARLSPAQIGA